MAHGTLCKMRMYPVNEQHPMLRFLPAYDRLKAMDINRGLVALEIVYSAALANALTQLSIPNAVFDGSAAPKHVWVASDHADDTDNATKDCRAVKVIGITASGFEVDTLRMAGLTVVEGAKLFYYIFHMYGAEFGTAGKDAKGNIILSDADPAGAHNDCLRIAAGAVESEGMAFWVPDDYLINLAHYHLVDIIGANALENVQVQVLYTNVDGGSTDPDLEYDMIRASNACQAIGELIKVREVTTSFCKVDIWAMYATQATNAYIRLIFLVAGMSSTLRGVS